MKTKWHRGDKVWWVCKQWHGVIQMKVFQVIQMKFGDNTTIVQYRLESMDGRDCKELVDERDLGNLPHDMVSEDVLFEKKEQAYEHLFAYMRVESERMHKRADDILADIDRIKVRNGLKG